MEVECLRRQFTQSSIRTPSVKRSFSVNFGLIASLQQQHPVKKMSEVIVLYDGYSVPISKRKMKANCSCVLIKGPKNVIVDTMTPWDKPKILKALIENNMSPEDISFVVSTHGHSDHIGNNNLFLQATHIVGFCISFKDKYYDHPFQQGQIFSISDDIKVIPTVGHTHSDVTVHVTDHQGQRIAITGDLFEKVEDIENSSIWMDAGSECPIEQSKNRLKIAEMSEWIVPGHGCKFPVTVPVKNSLRKQLSDLLEET